MSQYEFQALHQNVEHVFTLNITENNIKILMESMGDSYYWKGNYEKKYIEEISNKAGSYKTFQLFVKMLCSALKKDTSSVFFDIVNANDLLEMKRKINSNVDQSQLSENDQKRSTRKYLIISYSNEFENVRYPLPLTLIDDPDSFILLRTIERLKNKIKKAIVNQTLIHPYFNIKGEMEDLKLENINLRNKVRELELTISCNKTNSFQKEVDMVGLTSLPAEIEKLKNDYEKKIKFLNKTIEELNKKLSLTHQDFSHKDKLALEEFNFKEQEYVKIIKEKDNKLNELSNLFMMERKKAEDIIKQKNIELSNFQREMIFRNEMERKLKIKIANFEKEVEKTEKKVEIATFGYIKNRTKSRMNVKSTSLQSFSSLPSNHSMSSKFSGSRKSFNSENNYSSKKIYSVKKTKLLKEINNKIINFSSSDLHRSGFNTPSKEKKRIPTPTYSQPRSSPSIKSNLKSLNTKRNDTPNKKKTVTIREPNKDTSSTAKRSYINKGNSSKPIDSKKKNFFSSEEINSRLMKIQNLLNINK
jgi:hypothetical protein